jgi:hypothetical protein
MTLSLHTKKMLMIKCLSKNHQINYLIYDIQLSNQPIPKNQVGKINGNLFFIKIHQQSGQLYTHK